MEEGKIRHPPTQTPLSLGDGERLLCQSMLRRSGLPTMQRPRGLMTPRSPVLYLVLLVVTVAAIWFWSSR